MDIFGAPHIRELSVRDNTTWDMYYASLVSMTMHPGYTREGTHRPTLQECAEIADKMVAIRDGGK